MSPRPKPPKVFRQREGGTFFFKFPIDGKPVKRTTGLYSEKQAQAVADLAYHEAMRDAQMRKMSNGDLGPKDITLDIAAESYSSLVLDQNEASSKEALRRLAVVHRALGPDTMMTAISDKMVLQFAIDRANTISERTGRKLSPTTVNGELTVLQGLMNHCRTTEKIAVQEIDWSRMKRKVPVKQVRRLTLSEQDTILASAPEHYRVILEWALETGHRRSNLTDLKWSEINFETREVSVCQKGDRNHSMFLTSTMREILDRIPRHGEHVFTFVAQRTRHNPKTSEPYVKGQRYPVNYWTFGQWFAEHVKALGIKCTLHDLRRTFGSETMAAIGLDKASGMLGHSDTKVTQKSYGIYLSNEVAEASEVASKRRLENRQAKR